MSTGGWRPSPFRFVASSNVVASEETRHQHRAVAIRHEGHVGPDRAQYAQRLTQTTPAAAEVLGVTNLVDHSAYCPGGSQNHRTKVAF